MIVVVLTAAATALRYAFNPILGFRSPLLFHILAIALAAQIAGTASGLAVTACSVVLIDYFFMPPQYSLGPPPNAGDALALLLFTVVGIALSIFGGWRKRAEDEVRHIRYNLETAQHITNVGSWESNLSGKLWWSPETCNIFGVERRTQLHSDDFYNLVHPEDRDKVRKAVKDALAGGVDYHIQHRIVRKSDGQVRVVHQEAKLIRNGETRLIGSIRDITDQRRGEMAQEILSGLLHVCSACRRIRDASAKDEWYSMEGYLRLHTTAKFSHDMCPDCSKQWSSESRDGSGRRTPQP